MEHTKKNLKRIVPLFIGLVFVSVLIGASTITYFVEIETSATVDSLLEYSTDGVSWSNAEDLDIVEAVTIAGECVIEHDFKLRCSSNAQDNVTVFFDTSILPDGDGFDYVGITDSSYTPLTSVDINPGATVDLIFYISTTGRIKSGDYTVTASIVDEL